MVVVTTHGWDEVTTYDPGAGALAQLAEDYSSQGHGARRFVSERGAFAALVEPATDDVVSEPLVPGETALLVDEQSLGDLDGLVIAAGLDVAGRGWRLGILHRTSIPLSVGFVLSGSYRVVASSKSSAVAGLFLYRLAASDPSSALIRPLPVRFAEHHDSLRRRSDWFRKRSDPEAGE